MAVVLAPYGPKPLSLAMCLFALSVPVEHRPAVVYTQPQVYAPKYSTGIGTVNGRPDVRGYAVTWAGHRLYGGPA